eukprot:4499842-Prymnesium_polylepis.1
MLARCGVPILIFDDLRDPEQREATVGSPFASLRPSPKAAPSPLVAAEQTLEGCAPSGGQPGAGEPPARRRAEKSPAPRRRRGGA